MRYCSVRISGRCDVILVELMAKVTERNLVEHMEEKVEAILGEHVSNKLMKNTKN